MVVSAVCSPTLLRECAEADIAIIGTPDMHLNRAGQKTKRGSMVRTMNVVLKDRRLVDCWEISSRKDVQQRSLATCTITTMSSQVMSALLFLRGGTKPALLPRRKRVKGLVCSVPVASWAGNRYLQQDQLALHIL